MKAAYTLVRILLSINLKKSRGIRRFALNMLYKLLVQQTNKTWIVVA